MAETFEARRSRAAGRWFATLTLASAALCIEPSVARAEEVTPSGKGIVGGALLGAEVVTMTESLIGVRQGWAHLVGAGVGAIGGGIGGYAIEQSVSDSRVPVYMLAGGITLVIPALVLSLNATRYQPAADATEDRAPLGPAPEPGTLGGTISVGAPKSSAPEAPSSPPAAPTSPQSVPSTDAKPSAPPQSMIDVSPSQLRLAVPPIQVRPMYSMQQAKELGLPNHTEYRLPLLHVAF